jgi:peptidoglycan pentaglycine glycine transferase (the second and third glycine)
MNLVILNEDEFREFAIHHPLNNFHQTIEWGTLKEKNGWQKHILGLKKDDHIVAVAMILSKKLIIGLKIFYCPRGFLIDFNDNDLLKIFTQKLKKYVRMNNGIFLKIDPYVINKERDIDGNIIIGGEDNSKVVNTLKHLGYKHYGFNVNYGENLQPRWSSILYLENKNEADLLKEMDQQTRWSINKTLKLDFEIKEIKYEQIDTYKQLMEHTSKRREFIDRPLKYYQNMYNIMNPSNMIKILMVSLNVTKYKDKLLQQLTEAKQNKLKFEEKLKEIPNSHKFNNQLKDITMTINDLNKKTIEAEELYSTYGNNIDLAGAMFITYGDEISYLYSGAYEQFMKFNAQYCLQWEMIKYALNNNYKKYNFLGITGDFNKNNAHYGIYAFKKGFNSKVVELIGEFDLITKPLLYFAYKISFSLYKKLKKLKNNLK